MPPKEVKKRKTKVTVTEKPKTKPPVKRTRGGGVKAREPEPIVQPMEEDSSSSSDSSEFPTSESDGAHEDYADRPPTPEWTKGTLDQKPPHWQGKLFRRKMGKKRKVKKNAVCEKQVYLSDLKIMGLDKNFETLGWEAVVEFKGNTEGIYLNSLMEFLSTLERDVDGPNPPRTTMLKGTVNKVDVVLSFETLKQLANFDSKDETWYDYVNEKDYWARADTIRDTGTMLREVFVGYVGGKIDYLVENLSIRSKMLLPLLVSNISPRLGGQMELRKWDIPVLYALLTGELKLSFCQLVLMNVWRARNNVKNQMIPHARLLSLLLEKQQALSPNDKKTYDKKYMRYAFATLSKARITYKRTNFWHKLKTSRGEKLRFLQSGKSVPEVGVDTLDSSDDEVRKEKEGAAQAFGVVDEVLQGRVASVRPPDYVGWTSYEKISYDQNNLHYFELQDQAARNHAEVMSAIRQAEKAAHYAREMNINMTADDENEMRMWHDYHNGLRVERYPPYTDFTSLKIYEQGYDRKPMPRVHGSMWLPREYSVPHFQSRLPFQQPPYEYPPPQNQDGQGSSESNDPYDMSWWFDHMGGYFGGPPGSAFR